MATIPRFYVYVLARPNGKPFYVGKGQRGRIHDHEREARNGHRCHKCHVIRKIWKKGKQVQRYTVFTTNDEAEALSYEVELIALYGKHTLCNVTDGGDGASNPTEETRKKMRATYQRKSPQEKAEHRRKLSIAHKKPLSESHRLNVIAASRRKIRTAKWRANIGAGNSGKVRTKEALENQSRAHRKGQIYTMIAPDGTIYEDIDSVVGFGKEHGMTDGTVRNILRGSKNRAGWRGMIRKEAHSGTD